MKNRYLIITADDVGVCPDVTEASIVASEEGLVASLELMPVGPFFEDALFSIHKAKKADLGIHLSFNSEFASFRWPPCLPMSEVPSLCDQYGYCHQEVAVLHERLNVKELENEIYAQMNRLLEAGLSITHLSRHMFALESGLPENKREAVWNILIDFTTKFHLSVRSTNAAEARWLWAHQIPAVYQIIADTHNIAAEEKKNAYTKFLRDLPPGISEFIVHCGYNTEALRRITSSAPRREQDFQLMMSDDLRRVIQDEGIVLISWRDVPELLKEINP